MAQESTIVLSRSLHDFVFRMSMTPSNNEYPKIQEKNAQRLLSEVHFDPWIVLRCIFIASCDKYVHSIHEIGL